MVKRERHEVREKRTHDTGYKNQSGERETVMKEVRGLERKMASKRSPFDFLGQESRLLGTPAPGRSS